MVALAQTPASAGTFCVYAAPSPAPALPCAMARRKQETPFGGSQPKRQKSFYEDKPLLAEMPGSSGVVSADAGAAGRVQGTADGTVSPRSKITPELIARLKETIKADLEKTKLEAERKLLNRIPAELLREKDVDMV